MPFPWKKVKNTKISQLVSDHLESQRLQRGHLVVETGFPTSLVDLFVKNRDRLKKSRSSKKKAQIFDNTSPLPSSSLFPVPRGPCPSPLTSPSISPTPSSLSLASIPAVSSSLPSLNKDTQEADSVEEKINERPTAKGIIEAISRIFLVVVLTLGANKVAVGLTMSAFLLFLIEYLGKHSYRLLVPCSEAKRRLRLLMQRILRARSFTDKRLDKNNGCFTGSDGETDASSEFENIGGNSSICEIQVSRPMFVGDIQCVMKETGESGSHIRIGFQVEKDIERPLCDRKSKLERSDSKEVYYGCEISESKGNSKRDRMKMKIKHLVPRKFRGSKKGKGGLEGERKPMEEKIVAVLGQAEEKERRDARKLECDGKLSLLLSTNEQGNVGRIVMREEEEKQRKGDSGYLILCLVVLIGLVGGRIVASMLIVLWLLMLKSGEKLRRYLKWPVITQKSS